MQYRVGSVSVTNGSNVVTGTGTDWASIPSDAMFAIPSQNGVYSVQSIASGTSLILSAPWAGPDLTNVPYWITVDFTPFNSLPIPEKNDIDATRVLREALLIIDKRLNPGPIGLFSVMDIDSNPPSSPVEGEAHIIGTSPSGAWQNRQGQIAFYVRGSWVFYTASDGGFVRNNYDSQFYFYTAETNSWEPAALGGSGGVTPEQLALKLDISSFTAQNILDLIKQVDGVNSGLNADTVRGFTPEALRLWGNLVGVPNTFPPAAHTHTIGQVTGLQTKLDSVDASIASVQNNPRLFRDVIADEDFPAGSFIHLFDVDGESRAKKASGMVHGRPCHGYVLAAGNNGDAIRVYTNGVNNQISVGFSGAGYLSPFAHGAISQAFGDTPGQTFQYLGVVLGGNSLLFDPGPAIPRR